MCVSRGRESAASNSVPHSGVLIRDELSKHHASMLLSSCSEFQETVTSPLRTVAPTEGWMHASLSPYLFLLCLSPFCMLQPWVLLLLPALLWACGVEAREPLNYRSSVMQCFIFATVESPSWTLVMSSAWSRVYKASWSSDLSSLHSHVRTSSQCGFILYLVLGSIKHKLLQFFCYFFFFFFWFSSISRSFSRTDKQKDVGESLGNNWTSGSIRGILLDCMWSKHVHEERWAWKQSSRVWESSEL